MNGSLKGKTSEEQTVELVIGARGNEGKGRGRGRKLVHVSSIHRSFFSSSSCLHSFLCLSPKSSAFSSFFFLFLSSSLPFPNPTFSSFPLLLSSLFLHPLPNRTLSHPSISSFSFPLVFTLPSSFSKPYSFSSILFFSFLLVFTFPSSFSNSYTFSSLHLFLFLSSCLHSSHPFFIFYTFSSILFVFFPLVFPFSSTSF